MDVVLEREAVHILVVADRDELIAAVGAALGPPAPVVADLAAAEGVASAGDLALVVLDATDGGLSAVAALRRAHGEAPLPILAVGPDTADHRARAHAAGVDDYLAAPLDPARLRERAAVWARWRAAVAAPTARLADARRLAQLARTSWRDGSPTIRSRRSRASMASCACWPGIPPIPRRRR